MLTPKVLTPTPDPVFVKELALIDPLLRVEWAWSRYYKNCWVIERRLSPESYNRRYYSLLTSGEPRFIHQPIFNDDEPEYNEDGEQTGFKIIGWNQFDLAPEYEWFRFVTTPAGDYKQLATDTLLAIRREYAWNRNHSYSRARYEEEQRQQDEQRKKDFERRNREAIMEGMLEGWSRTGVTKTVGQPTKVLKGTEL